MSTLLPPPHIDTRICIVIVRAGSRCELSYPSGVTHVLSRMAANSTEQFEDKEHVLNAMNAYGGALDCQMFRWVDCLGDVGWSFIVTLRSVGTSREYEKWVVCGGQGPVG